MPDRGPPWCTSSAERRSIGARLSAAEIATVFAAVKDRFAASAAPGSPAITLVAWVGTHQQMLAAADAGSTSDNETVILIGAAGRFLLTLTGRACGAGSCC